MSLVVLCCLSAPALLAWVNLPAVPHGGSVWMCGNQAQFLPGPSVGHKSHLRKLVEISGKEFFLMLPRSNR